MSFLVKRLFKINVSLKTSVLVFCPMRVGPVRVAIYNGSSCSGRHKKNSANSPLSHQKLNKFTNSKACRPSPSEENPAGSTQSYNRQKTVAMRNLS